MRLFERLTSRSQVKMPCITRVDSMPSVEKGHDDCSGPSTAALKPIRTWRPCRNQPQLQLKRQPCKVIISTRALPESARA